MLQVAHILPVNKIDKNMPRQNYEMYLTHKVLEHPETFEFLAKDRDNSIGSFKILDNSACELGKGMDFAKVIKAAEIIGADEIVLPDVPRSGVSLTTTLQYLIDLPQEIKDKYSIAAVVQGETYEQVLDCMEQLLCIRSIDTIMLPKWYCSMSSSNGLGRHRLTLELYKMIQSCKSKVNIHWLGLDTGVRELITPWAGVVRSCDTGYIAALSTPQWSHLPVVAERPRELKIDLENMDVDMDRWNTLIKQTKYLVEEI